MFRDRDLLVRALAALLPPRAGYALTLRMTPRLDPTRSRYVAPAVRVAARDLLGDDLLAAKAAAGFIGSIACDDLDAFTAYLWPDPVRRRSVGVRGAEYLERGAAVYSSFHMGGGFPIFDVLRAAGSTPTFLCAPPRPGWTRYQRVVAAARLRHLGRTLETPFVFTGKNARASLEHHLRHGGAVVALLDVAPGTLGLRDVARAELFGRPVELPVGLLRLAAAAGAPVIPYDAIIDRGRRVLRFHEPARDGDPEKLLVHLLRTFERLIREHPADWQAWLEIDSLLGPTGRAQAAPAAGS